VITELQQSADGSPKAHLNPRSISTRAAIGPDEVQRLE